MNLKKLVGLSSFPIILRATVHFQEGSTARSHKLTRNGSLLSKTCSRKPVLFHQLFKGRRTTTGSDDFLPFALFEPLGLRQALDASLGLLFHACGKIVFVWWGSMVCQSDHVLVAPWLPLFKGTFGHPQLLPSNHQLESPSQKAP